MTPNKSFEVWAHSRDSSVRRITRGPSEEPRPRETADALDLKRIKTGHSGIPKSQRLFGVSRYNRLVTGPKSHGLRVLIKLTLMELSCLQDRKNSCVRRSMDPGMRRRP